MTTPDPSTTQGTGEFVLVSPKGAFWTGRHYAIGPINTTDISEAIRFPSREAAKAGAPVHALAVYEPKPASDYEEIPDAG
jgi:hypothetical protein